MAEACDRRVTPPAPRKRLNAGGLPLAVSEWPPPRRRSVFIRVTLIRGTLSVASEDRRLAAELRPGMRTRVRLGRGPLKEIGGKGIRPG